jgi:hypothetical protein
VFGRKRPQEVREKCEFESGKQQLGRRNIEMFVKKFREVGSVLTEIVGRCGR